MDPNHNDTEATEDTATDAMLAAEAEAIAADEMLTANIGARFAAERAGRVDYYEGAW